MNQDRDNQDNQDNQDQEKIISESVKLITNALNKACHAGIYSLQEAYAIQIALNIINNTVDHDHQ